MPDTTDPGACPEQPMTAAVAPPRAPGAVPFLGHAYRLVRDPLGWLDECRHTGAVLRMKLGPRALCVITDPDLVYRVLTDSDFEKGGPLMAAARSLLGNGLATCLREEHRRQRPLMQPAFTLPRIAGYTTVMCEEAAALAASWTSGRETDLMADLSSATLRVVIRAMLPTADAGEAGEIARRVRILLDGSLLRAAVPFSPLFRLPTPGNRRFERARDDTLAAAARIVATARAEPDTGGLLTPLFAPDGGAPDGGDAFTDEDLRDQVMTLLAAGGDTTATTLAWALHLLATHPEAERRLHEELDAVLDGGIAGPDDLPKLPFTRNVIAESLRLYPPVWMMSRVALVDVDLGGFLLPAGTEVFFSSYQLHHDPRRFPDPDSFDPDRWGLKETESRHAYIPFHAGNRKCIGNTFALTEASIMLSAITSRWRFRPALGHDPRPRPPLSMTPRKLRLVPELRSGRPAEPRSAHAGR